MNYKLIGILTPAKLKEMGFIEQTDQTDSSRKWWEIRNNDFVLIVNPSLDIELFRLEPATDGLNLRIESLYDLEMAIDWID